MILPLLKTWFAPIFLALPDGATTKPTGTHQVAFERLAAAVVLQVAVGSGREL